MKAMNENADFCLLNPSEGDLNISIALEVMYLSFLESVTKPFHRALRADFWREN